MLVILTLTLTVLAFGHQVYGADQVAIGIVLNEVMKDIGAPLALGGLLATLFGLGQVISSNPAGLIIERRGPRFALCLGIGIFSLFTLLTGLARTYLDASFYRVCFGIGQGVWNVTYYSTIGMLFAERRGLANAVLGLMFPIGVLWGAPATAIAFVWSGDWRTPFYVLGIVGFLITAIIILAVKSSTFKRPGSQVTARGNQPKSAESFLSILKVRNVALGCIIGMFFALTFSSILALYPTYLRTVLGMDPVTSGVIMSLQTWPWIIVAPIFLTISDRYGRKWFLCYYGLFSAFAVYYMFHLPPENFVLAGAVSFIYGVAGAGAFSMIMIFIQDSVKESKIGASTGLVNSFIYIGVTVAGPITGYIVSLWGWAFAGYWLAGCGVVFFIAALVVKETWVRKISGRQ